MTGYKCPFCEHFMALDNQTQRVSYMNFQGQWYPHTGMVRDEEDQYFRIVQYRCPNCKEISIVFIGESGKVAGRTVNIYPQSVFITFPEYVPEAIRKDYEEACSILELSSKASATLSRRCLQGMIRDFWGIQKSRLVDEINALKDKVPADQWRVIDGLRQLGNIGAHMEKDINVIVEIDPEEAQKLIKLVELLIRDWYINRHEQQQLYADILGIEANKKEQRNV